MSEIPLVADKPFPREAGIASPRCAALFLSASSAEPCGVEEFTSRLAAALDLSLAEAGCVLAPVSGRWRELPALLRRIAHADHIVFSVPLVAWKRTLVLPLMLLVFGFAIRRRISVFVHEWSDLHWLRRLSWRPFVMLSDTVLVLSPYIRDQIAEDRWISGAAKKCRLIPHPPTVRRPENLRATDMARQIEKVAAECDIVIGHFGALHRGKAPTALLEICDHLRHRGLRALAVFIGGFSVAPDDYEARFRARVRELALEKQVIVTGYIAGEDELFALFQRVGVFLFHFPEGLTARRSSVIACLQSSRPVVVSAPPSRREFLHHAGLTALIQRGALAFVPRSAGADEIADQLLAAAQRNRTAQSEIDVDAWWAATTTAARMVLLQPKA